MKNKGVLLLLFFIAGTLCSEDKPGLDLIRNGEARGAIVLPASAPAELRHAAEELQRYAAKITGVTLPITDRKTSGIGLYLLQPQDGTPFPSLKYEGFILAAEGDRIEIRANESIGILYGVYRILRENGFFWLYPEEEGEEFTPSRNFSVAGGIRTFNPIFTDRRMILNGGPGHCPETRKWLIRNGLGGGPIRFGNHEMMVRMIGRVNKSERKAARELLYREHPEYFGLKDGRRRISFSWKDCCQPCTSNPEVLRRSIRTVQEDINKIRRKDCWILYLLMTDDHMVWCDCPACRKQDPPEEASRRVMSTRWWRYVNAIAKEILTERNPDVRLRAALYQNYRDIPTGVTPYPGVSVMLCPHGRCYFHALDDPSCRINPKYRKYFEDWAKSGREISTFEYHTNIPGISKYAPMEKAWIRDLLYLAEIRAAGFGFVTRAPDGKYVGRYNDYRAKNLWYSQWQLNYISGVLSWEGHDAPEKALEDASWMYYKKAWPVMKRYRALLEKAMEKAGSHLYYGAPNLELGRAAMQPGLVTQARFLLAQAGKAVQDDLRAAKRIARETEYFEKNWVANLDEAIADHKKKTRLLHNADFSEIVDCKMLPGRKNWEFKDNKMPKGWQFIRNSPGKAEIVAAPDGKKSLRVTGENVQLAHQFEKRFLSSEFDVDFNCRLRGNGTIRFRFFNNKGMSVDHRVALTDQWTPFSVRIQYPKEGVKAFICLINGCVEIADLNPKQRNPASSPSEIKEIIPEFDK